MKDKAVRWNKSSGLCNSLELFKFNQTDFISRLRYIAQAFVCEEKLSHERIEVTGCRCMLRDRIMKIISQSTSFDESRFRAEAARRIRKKKFGKVHVTLYRITGPQ